MSEQTVLMQAARQFVPDLTESEPVGTAAHLVRVRSGNRDILVRQWPEATTGSEARFAVEVLARAHAASEVFPDPLRQPDDGVVPVGDRHFSAFTWLPGQPLVRYGDFRTPGGDIVDVPLPASAPAPAIVQQAARAIGAFHAATAELAEGQGSKHPLMSHLGQAERTWETQRRRVGRAAADFPEIRRWLRCGHRIIAIASDLVRQAGDTGNRVVVVHGDLWPANLLVDGTGEARQLTGIAGWSSLTVDTPLIDLAHLVTHMSGWSGARAEDVLAAYTDAAPLTPVERRLLPVVAAIDLLPTVGDLLILAFVDEEMATHEAQPVLRSGMKSLLSSLENLTHILAPDDEWAQRQTNANRQERRSSTPRTPRGSRTKQARRPGSGQSRQR